MLNQIPAPDDAPQTTAATVLIVDDSRAQLMLLTRFLRKMGLTVRAATSGEVALHICQFEKPDLIISDWVMPGMDGLEFCKRFRAMERDGYGYFILLTSKSEKGAVARGLDNGADDFLTKPVYVDELRARITAGERILEMQRQLSEQNRVISRTLTELQGLYDALDNDLIEAKKLQQSLVRDRYRRFGNADLSLLLRPSGHVGGDLVGFFPVGKTRLGIYAIDVSGHGISSALMTARLAGYLSATTPDQNVALYETEEGAYAMHPPDQVIGRLNRLVLEEMETEHYFTMLLADVDLASGRVRLAQAGHPHPLVQRADNRIELIGAGGLPVGLMMLNSLAMALGIAVGKIAISIISAFAIVYFRFPLRMAIFWVIFLTLMLPVEVRILPTFEVVADLAMLNTYQGLIIPLIASATATFLFRQFFLTVPDELMEAARVDGAGPLRFFKDILLPLSRTNLAALFVILFIYGWNQYLWPLLVTTEQDMYTVVMGIQRMVTVAEEEPQWHIVMGTACLALLPPVIVVVAMQRLFVKGLVETEK